LITMANGSVSGVRLAVIASIEVDQLMVNSDMPMMKPSSRIRSRSLREPPVGATATIIRAVKDRKNRSAGDTSGTSCPRISST